MAMRFKAQMSRIWGCALRAIILALCTLLLGTSDVYAAPQKIVALTFDDGPDAVSTPKVLDILREHRVKATFFVLGQEVNKYPDLVRREYQQGHMVANHSYDHSHLTKLTDVALQHELQDTNAAIREAGVPLPNLFRPPYADTNDAVRGMATSLGMTQTLWDFDIEVQDPENPPPAKICNRVSSGVKPGSIVLLHDGGSADNTDEALDCIIKRLKAKGYSFGLIYPSSQYNSLNSSFVLLSPEASPKERKPDALINLAYVAGVVLAVGLLMLVVGLIRGRKTSSEPA